MIMAIYKMNKVIKVRVRIKEHTKDIPQAKFIS